MTTTARPVRDDQHGTVTGYTYGCRCHQCRSARHDYVNENHVSDAVLDEVMDAIRAEADLDDLCTASTHRLAELVSVSAMTVNCAVRRLAELGRIRIGGVVGRGSARELHVMDES